MKSGRGIFKVSSKLAVQYVALEFIEPLKAILGYKMASVFGSQSFILHSNPRTGAINRYHW